MKKEILLIAVVLVGTAGLAQAEEGQLGVTFDITYLSSYIWRGFDVYGRGGHSAIQPSIDIDFYGTGFGVNLLHSRANGSGFENTEELDITLYYGNALFEGEAYATDYQVGWVYYNYPDNARRGSSTAGVADLQEIFASLSWPQICPAGVVPSYTVIRMWPAKRGSVISDASGWMHVFGLGYDLTVPDLGLGVPEQVLNLSAQLWYNGGAGRANVDHDWSHAVLGVSTDFEVTSDLTFTPALYYQASMDDSVNPDDETWVSLSMTYTF